MAKMIAAAVAFALIALTASPALAQLCAGTGMGANLCGTEQVSTNTDGSPCQCDTGCVVLDECCDDVCETCGFGCPDPPPPSPPPFPPLPPGQGVCSQIGCSSDGITFPFSEKNQCFCDSSCVFFNDCCDDSCDACGFCGPDEDENSVPGDSPLNAIIIDSTNLPQSITLSNEGFPNILDSFGPEVLFNFTSPVDITVYFTVCDAEFDVGIIVYDFTGEENPDDFALTAILATNDDPQFCGVGSTGAGTAIVFPAGETAIIQVEGIFADAIGEFTLVVNEVQPVCDDGIFNFCEGITTTPAAINPVDGCECFTGCTNCCVDAVDSCLIPEQPPSPPLVLTCEGICGGVFPGGLCFCDDLCTAFDDCCPDAIELCFNVPPLPPSPPATCVSFCGDISPSGCFCDELCTSYDDCCPDFEIVCLTAPPPGCPLIPGDVNDDDVVSVLDLVAVTNNILGLGDLPEGSECAADIDGNGIINVTDIVAIVGIIVGSG